MDPQYGILDPLGGHHEIDAVASRNQHRFFDLVAHHELAQCGARVDRGVTLANLEGRGPVIHTDEQNLQLSTPIPTTPNNRNAKPASALAAAWRAPCRPAKRTATSPA